MGDKYPITSMKYTPKIKICKFCQKEFECSNATPNKVFCSNECYKSFYHINIDEKHPEVVREEIRKCKYCNKEFLWIRGKTRQKYCSSDCLQAFYHSKYEERYPSELNQETRKCKYCNKEFIWSSKQPSQKYCSKECAIKSNNDKLKKAVWSEAKPCAICGKEFEWLSSKPSQKYCSPECRKAATLIQIKNRNKSGKEADEPLRNTVYLKVLDIISKMDQSKGNAFNGTYIDYSIIGDISEKTRETVLNRDRHECQICRRKDSLQLHHLIKRKNGGNHQAENLITLCTSCHRHIETGDLEHATIKCFKNAKKYYYVETEYNKPADALDIDELRDKLTLLFEKLKESPVGEDSGIMVCLDEALDLIDLK